MSRTSANVSPIRPPLEAPVSGHVFRVDRVRGSAWYAKYRLTDGRQVQKRIGAAWTKRGRPAAGTYTKHTAEAWLDDVLARARLGTLPGSVRTGATFADAVAEWLRWAEHDRACKPSTLSDYRYTAERLSRDFGAIAIEDITPTVIERWRAGLAVSNRTIQKYLVVMHGIFRRAMRVWGLPRNPLVEVERPRVRVSDDLDAFTPEDVHALARAAATEQDAALFLTAAFTGLRLGELLGLEWGDIDFPASAIRVRRSYNPQGRATAAPKSGKVRSVPMVGEVASALARLGERERFTSDGDLVFAGATGSHESATMLRRRYKAALEAAGLRDLRFHDLRHTFGTLAIQKASILQVKAWMGHADVQTTMRYLHHTSRAGEAALLEEAFATAERPGAVTGPTAGAGRSR